MQRGSDPSVRMRTTTKLSYTPWMNDKRTTLTTADEGKRVLDADGEAIGRIVEVTDGHGYVAPEPSLVETVKARLGWGNVTVDAHPLDEGSVAEITEDAVRLRGTL